MRRIILAVCFLLFTVSIWAITPGVADFLSYSSLLKDKKVGIVTNQTSVVGKQHSVDFLRDKQVDIVRVFCPEHGFRGDADAGESVGDYKDEETGLPVISLYGKKKKPLLEDLKGLDVVIFDMQDVGVRFYTYLSTLHYVMEACAENRIPVIVMDRANPNAFYIDGPVLDMKYTSFVGMHPVPIVYGMTIGEYAKMINGESWLKGGVECQLIVVPCRNWSRDMTFDLSRSPSPNLPDRVSVMLYPSVCLFEGTVISEGRGTYTPFQMFGHPNLKNMSYSFTPISIEGMSKSPKCMNKKCYGMDLRAKYDEVKAGKSLRLDWLIAAHKNYDGKAPFFNAFFEKLAGTDQLRKDIEAGKTEKEIKRTWSDGLNQFKQVRAKYLIY